MTETQHRAPPKTVLEVRGLTIGFGPQTGGLDVVHDISFDLYAGEMLCIVGESGSGKSVTSKALMRIGSPAKIRKGQIRLIGPGGDVLDIGGLKDRSEAMRAIRGDRIAMVFQEPMSSLSPVHTIGDQIIESIMLHRDVTKQDARSEAIEALRRVQIPNAEAAIDMYTFEFSGGMRQRAMIAMALSCNPEILIADEPTTALDVTTQAEILHLLKRLQSELGMSVIFITHDTGVVAEIADRVGVMYQGRFAEIGPVKQIFHDPQNLYTRHLIKASSKFTIFGNQDRGGTLPSPKSERVLTVENLNLTFRKSTGLFFRKTVENHALKNISLTLNSGENLGIVGESGSGKTTLVRALVGLLSTDSGTAIYRTKAGDEVDLLEPNALRKRGLNQEIRMVFQDPFSSLNPRMTVEQVIAEPLVVQGRLKRSQIRERVAELLRKVGLPETVMSRYPHAFSGGQRQRISIARALAVDPRLIIADEATSALDGSVRAQVLDLMFDLQADLGLSYIFVGHDLGVVRYFCDRIAVMNKGELVEMGAAQEICLAPREAYTKKLISAVPSTDPDRRNVILPN